MENFENHNQEAVAAWKREFLLVVGQGNETESLRRCLETLPSLSSRFNDESDENAETNRGNFILETLHNFNAKKVRRLLSDQSAEKTGVVASLKEEGFFTPFFLADAQAVRLVRSRCRFELPEKLCKADEQQHRDRLDVVLTSLNRYLALANPFYISASFLVGFARTDDPIDKLNRL